MARRLFALLLALAIGAGLIGCESSTPRGSGMRAEPGAIEVHVCDPWCVHAPPGAPGKWW